MSSIAEVRGWERAGEIVMATKGKMVVAFILEETMCKSAAWTAGLAGNVLLKGTCN